jgi:hypothetical protein
MVGSHEAFDHGTNRRQGLKSPVLGYHRRIDSPLSDKPPAVLLLIFWANKFHRFRSIRFIKPPGGEPRSDVRRRHQAL